MTATYDRESLLEKHPRWLKRLDHKCQFTGRTVGKRFKGRYRRYNFHHTTSPFAYGRERPGYNYLLLSPLAHGFVHNVLGGAWFSDRDVTVQNKRAERLPCPWLWRYPNPPQRFFHFWCRLPFGVRWFIAWVFAIVWAAIEIWWFLNYGG